MVAGWLAAKVELLGARSLQCYRCLKAGHVRQRCTATVKRGGCCYRCGSAAHLLAECRAEKPHCMVCAGRGQKADYRLGGPACRTAQPKKKKGGRGDAKATPLRPLKKRPPPKEALQRQRPHRSPPGPGKRGGSD